MPSRFNINNDECMHTLLRALNVDLGPLPIRHNLAPTDQVPVIHEWEGKRIISDMRWWLVPGWSDGPTTEYPMYNARCETLDKSRAYQPSFRYKRCIIPARSFIQWSKTQNASEDDWSENENKTPFLFSALDPSSEEPQAMAFAGIWEYWSDGVEHVLSCAIVTRPAIERIFPYGSRIPLMLSLDDAKLWLDHRQDVKVFAPLFKTQAPYSLDVFELDKQIGNAKNKQVPIIIQQMARLENNKPDD